MVDSSNAEGAFITEIEVFFQKKDEVDGCQVYLTDTVGQVPTENIIPHGFARKPSNSTLRVQCDLSGSTESIVSGTRLVGQTSGATGIVGFTATFEDAATNVTKNVSNSVYDIILTNYVNEFIPGEVIAPDVSPASASTFTIVKDEYLADRIDSSRHWVMVTRLLPFPSRLLSSPVVLPPRVPPRSRMVRSSR